MIVMSKVLPTFDDEFEEGYNQGFDDGYDMAILAEKDREWVYQLVKECCNYVDKEDMETHFDNRFNEIMEKRKTGVSFIFELEGDD